MSDELTPVEVRAPRGARVLEVEWADGSTTRYRHVVLRAFCPCAHCQGHQGPIRWVQNIEASEEQAFELADIEEVGSYALRLCWADRHATGLYSFRYLRELAALDNEPDAAAKLRTFGR